MGPKGELSKIWFVAEPSSWPLAPEYISTSICSDVEACPRRWALSSGSYPQLWEKAGYPPRPILVILRGHIVHLAVARVAAILVGAECTSVSDPAAVKAIRDAGGLTSLMLKSVADVVSRQRESPRCPRYLDEVARELEGEASKLRTKVQGILRWLTLVPHKSQPSAIPQSSIRPLGTGLFREVGIRAPTIGWKGTVDLLALSETECEIIEVKSGIAGPDHPIQIRRYGVIWEYDADKNPMRRRPTKLTLIYPGNVEAVPLLSESERQRVVEELRAKREAVLKAISQSPPRAQPSKETCSSCEVKQNCAEYWKGTSSLILDSDGFTDAEVMVTKQNALHSWVGTVEVSPTIAAKTPVVIRINAKHGFDLPLGRLRLVRVWSACARELEGQVSHSLSIGLASEVFSVS